jgi:uncharacterized protein (TIGR00290 family)
VTLPPGTPIFDEAGALTREFLLDRGYCCENGCRNCPYGFDPPERRTSPASRVLLSWSSGKDSAWTLHVLRKSDVEVVGLLTTLNAEFDRVAMHAVRRELVETQARAAQLPIQFVRLPWPCSNEQYEAAMEKALEEVQEKWAITQVAFGDLFLEDIRRYREEKLAQHTGLTPLFPLWELPTDELAHEMVSGGLKARLTCVDPRQLPASFAGRDFDLALLADLPSNVDPCGERGEFHTLAYAGPMFNEPISVRAGEVIERDGFVFADILPGTLAEYVGRPRTKCPQ